MTREEQMWKAVEEEHGKLSQRESYVTLTAMEWADENKPVDWRQVRIQAAIAAMQGILSNKEFNPKTIEGVVATSVNIVDALVKELKGE